MNSTYKFISQVKVGSTVLLVCVCPCECCPGGARPAAVWRAVQLARGRKLLRYSGEQQGAHYLGSLSLQLLHVGYLSIQATIYKCCEDGSIAPMQAYADTDVSAIGLLYSTNFKMITLLDCMLIHTCMPFCHIAPLLAGSCILYVCTRRLRRTSTHVPGAMTQRQERASWRLAD